MFEGPASAHTGCAIARASQSFSYSMMSFPLSRPLVIRIGNRIPTIYSVLMLCFLEHAAVVGESQASTFRYDDLNRLTQVQRDNGATINYFYDELGNRTRKQVIPAVGVGSPTRTLTVTPSPTVTSTPTNTPTRSPVAGPTSTLTQTPEHSPTQSQTVAVTSPTATVTPTADRPGPCAYVANSSSNSVSVINTDTNQVVATLTNAGSNPSRVALSPDGRRAYVTNATSNGAVVVLNTATGSPIGSPISVGSMPMGVAVAPDGKRVYVANSGSDNVSIIDTVSNSVVRTVSVGNNPQSIAFTPEGRLAYVVNANEPTPGINGSVSMIDTASETVTMTLNIGSYPRAIDVTRRVMMHQPSGLAGNFAFITNSLSGTLTAIQTGPPSSINFGATAIPIGTQPWPIALSDHEDVGYVGIGGVDGSVAIFNTLTNALIGTPIAVGNTPADIALTPDGSRAYVTNQLSNSVSVMDIQTKSVIATIAVGSGPQGIAIADNSCPGQPTPSPTPTHTPTPTTAATPCSTYQVLETLNVLRPQWLAARNGRLVVSSSQAGRVYVIDRNQGSTATEIPLTGFANARGEKIAFYGEEAFVPLANLGSNSYLAVIDTANRQLLRYLRTGHDPSAAAFYNSSLYVTRSTCCSDPSPPAVEVLDREIGILHASFDTGLSTVDIALIPSLRRAYAANLASADLSVLDLDTHATIGSIPLPINPKVMTVIGTTVYVAGNLVGGGDNSVIVTVDATTNSIVGSPIAAGLNVGGIASLGNRIFATNQKPTPENILLIADTNTRAIVQTITVGNHPRGIAIDPSTGLVYVANSQGDSLSVLGCIAPTATQTRTVTTTPSETATPTQTAAQSGTDTPSATPSSTATQTPTLTQGVPFTPCSTCAVPTYSPTSTVTITATLLPTSTPTITRTSTSTRTVTETATPLMPPTNTATHTPAQVGVDVWTGHGPEGGTVRALAIDPTTPTTLYAGTEGGVFKSTDAGITWRPTSSGLPTPSTISALLIDPLTPTTLYAGSYDGSGVFKSTDAGGSWSAVNAGLEHQYGIGSLGIDPVNPSTLYAGTQRNGIFKSTDAGASWTPANSGLNYLSPGANAIAVDPTTPSTLYAGISIATSLGAGVSKSTNSGGSWNAVNSGLSNNNVRALAINPIAPATLYAGTSGGVFKSTDAGGSWTAVNSGLTATNVSAIAISPTTPSTLYAGTNGGIFKSTDAGGSWNPASSDLNFGGGVLTLAINPTTPSTLYAGTFFAGVFKSTNAGGSWGAANSGLIATNVISLAVDPSGANTLYAGTRGSGVFKSTDAGESWITSSSGLIAPHVYTLAINPLTPTILYAGTSGGLSKSTDAGGSWSTVNSGLTATSVTALAINPTTPSTLYAGTNGGIFKSTDAGVSWSATNSGLSNLTVHALIIDATAPTTLYAGTHGGVFKSSDSGGSWSSVNIGLTNQIVFALIIDPTMPSTLYAGTPLSGSYPGHSGVFKSTDAGGSWSAVNSGLGSTNLLALGIDGETPSTLYAGTYDAGVFKSTDAGGSWTAVNTGLATLSVNVLAIDPITPSRVYAGTSGGGVLELERVLLAPSPTQTGTTTATATQTFTATATSTLPPTRTTTATPTPTRTSVPPLGCGDGFTDPSEQCDDGNVVSCDGCSHSCEVEIAVICGDGVLSMGCEQCDDDNTSNGDGCDSFCRSEEAITGNPGPGGSVTTDLDGTGPTADDPLETRVMVPFGGFVSILETADSTSEFSFNSLAIAAAISSLGGTAEEPLVIDFYLAASLLPQGVTATAIAVLSGGVVVPPCTGASGALPDPCVSGREDLPGGTVHITVLSSGAAGPANVPLRSDRGAQTTTPELWTFGSLLGTIVFTNAAALPGGVACVGASLVEGGVSSVTSDLVFDSTNFEINPATIAPAIGPTSPLDKRLTLQSVAAGTERLSVGGNAQVLPAGNVYAATVKVNLAISPGIYAFPTTNGAQITVTTCHGDCGGDGSVSIGELARCINTFLGQPLCSAANPVASCPVADANLDGGVSIGEVVQCANRLLAGCPE